MTGLIIKSASTLAQIRERVPWLGREAALSMYSRLAGGVHPERMREFEQRREIWGEEKSEWEILIGFICWLEYGMEATGNSLEI